MTNAQIIMNAMMQAGIDPVENEVHTFAGWKRGHYDVKKGEKAAFKARIWKPVASKTGAGEEGDGRKLILVNAAFFTSAQVEKEEDRNDI